MKKHKKNIKKKLIWLLFLPIISIIIYFVFLKNIKFDSNIDNANIKPNTGIEVSKLDNNIVYKGELDSKTIYFKTDSSFGTNAFHFDSNNKAEYFYQKDLEKIKNKEVVYKDKSKIELIEGYFVNNFLYLIIHTEKTNSLVKVNLNNSKSEEILKENIPNGDTLSFSITKIVENYIVMYYHGITGGLFDMFILNTNNKNRITIESKEINRLDVLNGNIIVDLENHKVSYPKGKMIEVNCENNPQEYEMGCEGMFEINGKYFDVISTKETVELDLP